MGRVGSRGGVESDEGDGGRRREQAYQTIQAKKQISHWQSSLCVLAVRTFFRARSEGLRLTTRSMR